VVGEEKMSKKRGDPWDEIEGLPRGFEISRIARKASKEPSWKRTLFELQWIGAWLGAKLQDINLAPKMEFDFHLGRILQEGRDPDAAYEMFDLINKGVELHVSQMCRVLELLDGLSRKLEEEITDVLQVSQF